MATVSSRVSVTWIESTLMAATDSCGRYILICRYEGQGVELIEDAAGL
jgi:hypothetical protein